MKNRDFTKEAISLSILFIICFVSYLYIFGTDIPGYDDHPGQLFRLWLVFKNINFNFLSNYYTYWFAGYPESLFYPPGIILLGLLLKILSFNFLSYLEIYRAIVFMSFILPAISTYICLRLITNRKIISILMAAITMLMDASIPSGVHEGVIGGMISSRISIGLVPLLILLLVKSPPGYHIFYKSLISITMGLILIFHPYHFVTAIILFFIWILTKIFIDKESVRNLMKLTIFVSAFVLFLTAFWLVPLLFFRDFTLPFQWSSFSLIEWLKFSLRHRILLFLIGGYLVFAIKVISNRKALSGNMLFLIFIPIGIILFAFINNFILINEFSVFFLDSIRMLEGVFFILPIITGIGISLTGKNPLSRISLYGVFFLILILLIFPLNNLTSFNEDIFIPFISGKYFPGMREIISRYNVDDLWKYLNSNNRGRVLFTSSKIYLTRETHWYSPHSHIMSLIPVYSNREIINGIFTHPSPIAGLFYYGVPGAKKIDRLVEKSDGISLFGISNFDNETENLLYFLRKFNIDTIIVAPEEQKIFKFIKDNKNFHFERKFGNLYVFRVNINSSAISHEPYISSTISNSSGKFVINVKSAAYDGTIILKYFYFPGWKARIVDSTGTLKEIPIKKDKMGMMEIYAPRGENYSIIVEYSPSRIFAFSMLLSILSFFFIIIRLLRFARNDK